MHMSTAYFHYNEISCNIVIYNNVFFFNGDIVRYNVKKQIDWGYNGNMTGIDQNMKDIPSGEHTKTIEHGHL